MKFIIIIILLFMFGCSQQEFNKVEEDNIYFDIEKSGHQTFVMMFVRNKWKLDHPEIYFRQFSFTEYEDGITIHYKWNKHTYFSNDANGKREEHQAKAGKWELFVDNETLKVIIK